MRFFINLIKSVAANPLWLLDLLKIKYGRKRKRAFLIGTPVHGNLGDHLIALEEIAFLKDYFSDYCVFECTMPLYLVIRNVLYSFVDDKDIIFISGGGWMSNLWIDDENIVRDIVKNFPDNRVVLFPQTAYYTQNKEGKDTFNKTIKVLNSHKNLFLMFRDYESYILMCNSINNDNIVVGYYPDMALYGSFFDGVKVKSHDYNRIIGVCLREDVESDIDRKNVIEIFKNKDYVIKEFSTVRHFRVYPRDRIKELNRVKLMILNSEIVLTDRLHAMLFAVLNNTPCVALNNKTGKVFGVSLWLEYTNLVRLSSDSEVDIQNCLEGWHNKGCYVRHGLLPYFDKMAIEIRKGVKN